ncbi:MAG: ATP-binding protein [Cytophagales bacterium]|nr:ATP-binding protein [Cytophagales bacterium]
MEYKHQVNCSKEKLGDLREFVRKVLDRLEIAEFQKNELVLAIDEVCANVIIHSHQCNAKDWIQLTIKTDNPQGLVFEVIDSGKGFNISKYRTPSLEELIEQRRKGGLGLRLIRKIMDEVHYEKSTHHHTYRFFKKCQHK